MLRSFNFQNRDVTDRIARENFHRYFFAVVRDDGIVSRRVFHHVAVGHNQAVGRHEKTGAGRNLPALGSLLAVLGNQKFIVPEEIYEILLNHRDVSGGNYAHHRGRDVFYEAHDELLFRRQRVLDNWRLLRFGNLLNHARNRLDGA